MAACSKGVERTRQFTNNQGLPTFGQGYLDSITETVSAGAVQAWDFYNNT